jgi:hypothetical protein
MVKAVGSLFENGLGTNLVKRRDDNLDRMVCNFLDLSVHLF